MALKNDESIPEFGKRILGLMNGKSPHTVATDLINAGLVKVNSRGKFEYADEKNKSAIGSVEKRIREHIHSSSPDCLQGEYVLAYCAYFHCSADYLFGLTDIESSDIEIRRMCEKTGVSEIVIKRFCEENEHKKDHAVVPWCWSKLMEGDLFYRIPSDWFAAFNEVRKWQGLKASIDAFSIIQEDVGTHFPKALFSTIEEDSAGHYASYQVIIFKLAQRITAALEKLVEDQVAETRTYDDAVNELVQANRESLAKAKRQQKKKQSNNRHY